MQAFRLPRETSSEHYREDALRESDAAVTELKNAVAFADRAPAIGSFLFVVNVRLQVVAELDSVLLTSAAFHSQINEWVSIVRSAANEIEGEIRAENQRRLLRRTSIVGEVTDCDFDEETRRAICEVVREGHKRVTIFYSNISETIDYAFDSDRLGSGLPFRNESEALERGILDDLQNLGVNNLRQLASIWEATRRSSGLVLIWPRFMGRSLTELELRLISEAPRPKGGASSGQVGLADYRLLRDTCPSSEEDASIGGTAPKPCKNQDLSWGNLSPKPPNEDDIPPRPKDGASCHGLVKLPKKANSTPRESFEVYYRLANFSIKRAFCQMISAPKIL